MASSSSTPGAAVVDDDLEQLLGSALDDFASLDFGATPQSGGEADRRPVQGLGMGLPDPKAPRRRASKQQPKAGAAPARGSYAAEALEKLTRETREAVRGLESSSAAAAAADGAAGIPGGALDSEAMVDEFVKQFEELAGSQGIDSIVETMMQQLLSKEILHEPMKEIVERYPKWLEEHKGELSKEEHERYHRQFELMVELNEVYENDPNNFHKITEIMEKMQECGQPPSDIVQEIVPGLDMSNLGHLSPEMLESSPNCSVM